MKTTHVQTVILDIEDEIDKYMYEDIGDDSDDERHPFIWLIHRVTDIQNMSIEKACNLRMNSQTSLPDDYIEYIYYHIDHIEADSCNHTLTVRCVPGCDSANMESALKMLFKEVVRARGYEG